MQSNKFEEAFSDFIDQEEYDEAKGAVFDLVRAAFLSGWQAAGGTPPQKTKVFTILKNPSDE